MSNTLPCKYRNTLQEHAGAVHCLSLASSGNYCLSAGADKTIRLWNVFKSTLIKRYEGGHGYPIFDLDLTSSNSQFVSVGEEKFAVVWDVQTGKIIRKLGGSSKGHTQRINAVCYAHKAEDSVICTASYDRSVRFWDLRTAGRYSEPLQVLSEAADSVTDVRLYHYELLTCSVDGHIRVYDIRTGYILDDCLSPPIGKGFFSHDGNCILASCLDSSLRLIDKSNGDCLAIYKGHCNEHFALSCQMTSDDAFVVCGSEDGNIYYWELVDSTIVRRLSNAHQDVVSCVCVQSNMLITASHDATVKWYCYSHRNKHYSRETSKQPSPLDPFEFRPFRLVEKAEVNHNSRIFRFALPNPNDTANIPLGKHIYARAKIDGKEVRRPYNPISFPEQLGSFDILVKASLVTATISYLESLTLFLKVYPAPYGQMSRYLDSLKMGEYIEFRGPKGKFEYRTNMKKHFGIIVGGTGITAVFQLIQTILRDPLERTRIRLIYANVSEKDILLRDKLEALTESFPQRFHLYFILNEPPPQWSQGEGFITEQHIQQHIGHSSSNSMVLVCGPPVMTKAVGILLNKLGYKGEDVFKF
eukprot:jgi/Galph1/5780/GphlegSOOS_G4531.1